MDFAYLSPSLFSLISERVTFRVNPCRTKLSLPLSLRASILTTVPDSTSQKFLLIGQIARKDQKGDGRVAAVFLDFAVMGRRQCGDSDFERWYARKGEGRECIMGHKVCFCVAFLLGA